MGWRNSWSNWKEPFRCHSKVCALIFSSPWTILMRSWWYFRFQTAGRTYNIPIVIWLMDTHPSHAPVCFVDPTPDMCLKPSRNMDHSGRVYLPYLHQWSQVRCMILHALVGIIMLNKYSSILMLSWFQANSNLLDLVKVLIVTFSEMPPVFTKPAKTENTVQQSTPYPQQGEYTQRWIF